MLARLLTAALIALPMLLGAARAEAAIISGTVTFSFPNAGPLNPFAGSFDITFDNSADIAETTVGLSNVVLPFALTAGVAAYEYIGLDPSGTGDVFWLGGTQNSVRGVGDNTSDFVLLFSGISTGAPTLSLFYYSTGAQVIHFPSDPGTLTFTRAGTAVPTPAALALFGVGLLGLVALRRRAG